MIICITLLLQASEKVLTVLRLISVLVVLLTSHACLSATEHSDLFTPAERAWIKAHPEVTYTVQVRWPQEFVENGVHKGLSRSILDIVEHRTGLRFVYIPQDEALLKRPMLISAVNRDLLTPEERRRWLMTFAWANTMPMIVGKNTTTRIRTLDQLRGQTLALADGSDYEPWLRRYFPDIHLRVEPDIVAALDAVREGKSAAAMGSGLVMLPILQRHYLHNLAIIAQVQEMASGISMAVDPADPELRSVLDKTMEVITAKDAQNIFIKWIGIVDLGTPGLPLILYHYRYEATVFGVMLLLLLGSLVIAVRARNRAKRSEKHKSEFLAVMSHEIRTPMNSIIAALELLKREKLTRPQQAYNEVAYSSSQNLTELLNNILENESLAQRRFEITPEPLNAADLLIAVCDSQRLSAEKKSLTLDLTYSPEISSRAIMADPLRLRQVLTNLLSNAIKFTERGSVSVDASCDMRGEIVAGLRIEVRDTGAGMTPEMQRRLFKSWSRGAHPASGSGLGLYLCRNIITLMKGTITLSSAPGEGTAITVTLPAEECSPPSAAEAAGMKTSLAQCPACVLLVEDHTENLKLITDQLRTLGCDVCQAVTAAHAMAQLEDENYYDIILLDCGLPDADGYTLARQIRDFERREQREATPLVAISALSGQKHRDQCYASGMDVVLTKPIGMSELSDLLRKWCEGYQPSSPPQTPAIHGMTPDVSAALRDDLASFLRASSDENLPYMLHHLHRIRGVALMYEMHELARYAGSLEDTLRDGLPVSGWRPPVWESRLKALISPEA